MTTRKCLVIFLIVLSSAISYCQEVELGLPFGHSQRITSAEFSPDNSILLTASEDETVKLFDIETGALLYSVQEQRDDILYACFNKEGNYFLTYSNDFTACLFKTKTAQLVHKFGGKERVYSAQFSEDGKKLLISGYGYIKIIDILTGDVIVNLSPVYDTGKKYTSKYPVKEVVSSENEELLVIRGANERHPVMLYNYKTGVYVNLLKNTFYVRDIQFSPDDHFISITANDSVSIFQSTNGELVRKFAVPNLWVGSTKFSQDSEKIILPGKTYQVFDIKTGEKISKYNQKNYEAIHLFNNVGNKFIATTEFEILICEFPSGNIIQEYPQRMVMSVKDALAFSYSSNEQLLFTYQNQSIKTYDLHAEKLLSEKSIRNRLPRYSFSKLSLSGSHLFISSESVHGMFNLDKGKFNYLFDDKDIWDEILTIPEFSPDEKSLIINYDTMGYDSKDYYSGDLAVSSLFDVATGREIQSFNGPSNKLKYSMYSPDGKFVLSVYDDSISDYYLFRDTNILCFEVSTSSKLWQLHGWHKDENVDVLAFNSVQLNTAGDQIVASAYGYPVVLFFDASNGEFQSSLEGFDSQTNNTFFSPHDDYVISISSEGQALLYSNPRGKVVGKFHAHYHERSRNGIGDWLSPLSNPFSPDGKHCAIAQEDYSIAIVQIKKGKIVDTLEGHTDEIIDLKYSPNGKYILTASEDNTVKLFETETGNLIHSFSGINDAHDQIVLNISDSLIVLNLSNGGVLFYDLIAQKELVRYFILDENPDKWIHIHPSGLFDASTLAMDVMYWTKGLEVIEFKQLKDRYWLPGLWKKVMSGEELPDVRDMRELKLQPKVEILGIEDGVLFVQMTKREGGYGNISIHINDKEAVLDARGDNFEFSKSQVRLEISLKDHPFLKDGINNIRVFASSEDGFVKGRGAEVVYSYDKNEQITSPEFYSLVIGIGDYANDFINLQYAENDAMAMATSLRLAAENLFGEGKTHVYLMTSKTDLKPTKENIQEILLDIGKEASSQDVMLIYLAGHGISWGGNQGDFLFLTSEAISSNEEAYNDPAIRTSKTVSTDEWVEWLKEIPALKQVMIIDACGSGKAIDNLVASREVGANQIKAIDRMKDRTGMFVISGCTADAVSYEASIYGQGLLTYSILQGMKGAALKPNNFIDVHTIMDYARETVPMLAAGIGGIQTPQLLYPRGGSFDIGYLTEEDKNAIPLASPKKIFVRSVLINGEQFEDDLGLSESLNNALNSISSSGAESKIVFFDINNYDGACKISGSYQVMSNSIQLTIKLRCANEASTYSIVASNKEELIEKILIRVL